MTPSDFRGLKNFTTKTHDVMIVMVRHKSADDGSWVYTQEPSSAAAVVDC